MLRTLGLLRDEAVVLDAAVDAALRDAGASRRRSRRCGRCRLRCAGSRCSGSPIARAAPRWHTGPRRSWRWDEGGALDVGGGLRAEIHAGALRFGASRGPAAQRPRPSPS